METKCFSCILSCIQMWHWSAGAADHWAAVQCNAAAACLCFSVFNCPSNYQRGLLMFAEIQRQHCIVHYVPFAGKFRSISTQITIFCWDAAFIWGLMLFLHLHFLNKQPKPLIWCYFNMVFFCLVNVSNAVIASWAAWRLLRGSEHACNNLLMLNMFECSWYDEAG